MPEDNKPVRCNSVKPGTAKGDFAKPIKCLLLDGHKGDHIAVGTDDWNNRRKGAYEKETVCLKETAIGAA